MLTDFKNSFTAGLTKKFAAKLLLYFPVLLKRVVTLPCEIQKIKNINNNNNNNNNTGDDREVAFIFQRLSVLIQRLNSALFSETFALHDDPDL